MLADALKAARAAKAHQGSAPAPKVAAIPITSVPIINTTRLSQTSKIPVAKAHTPVIKKVSTPTPAPVVAPTPVPTPAPAPLTRAQLEKIKAAEAIERLRQKGVKAPPPPPPEPVAPVIIEPPKPSPEELRLQRLEELRKKGTKAPPPPPPEPVVPIKVEPPKPTAEELRLKRLEELRKKTTRDSIDLITTAADALKASRNKPTTTAPVHKKLIPTPLDKNNSTTTPPPASKDPNITVKKIQIPTFTPTNPIPTTSTALEKDAALFSNFKARKADDDMMSVASITSQQTTKVIPTNTIKNAAAKSGNGKDKPVNLIDQLKQAQVRIMIADCVFIYHDVYCLMYVII